MINAISVYIFSYTLNAKSSFSHFIYIFSNLCLGQDYNVFVTVILNDHTESMCPLVLRFWKYTP